MTSALVSVSSAPDAPDLVADLESVGIHVLGAADHQDLVHEVVRQTPDVLVCWDGRPDDAFFATMTSLASTAPLPIVVFTEDHAAEKIERSASSGIHAYVVSGYATHRLRSTIQVARARFHREQALRGELTDVTRRFEERKLVDRAKGILMRARQISEDDAFRILRTTSMHSKQRVGRISQRVIDAARDAESVNRAGLLRMLSQRLVKSCALMVLGADASNARMRDETIERIDATLDTLRRVLSKATYGDLIDQVLQAWTPLKAAAAGSTTADRLTEIDALAERLLEQADQLTDYLQTVAATRTLRVINVSGRQRMLAQRFAKQGLLADVPVTGAAGGALPDLDATRIAFEEGLAYLRMIPLSSREISALLDASVAAWDSLIGALPLDRDRARQIQIDSSSETLLDLFNRLTDQYERSMQILIG